MYNEYGKVVFQVTKELMAIISQGLGQPDDFLFDKIGKARTIVRTLVNY